MWHARRQIAAWRIEFNQERPHSSLDYRTPNEFAQACLAATASSVTQ
ncbi:MAG: transposase [Ktedonobacteraceae bacterium]|nr:transposase [Ktedonobacteraceae bacterium]